MIKFQKILWPCLLLLFLHFTYAAKASVRVEVKTFDDNSFFIFYHSSRDQILNINSEGNLVRVTMDTPSDFEIVNSLNFNQLANYPELDKDKKVITFTVKEGLKFQSIINGERLTAIKFKSTEENNNLLTTTPTQEEVKADTSGLIKSDQKIVQYKTSKREHIISFEFDDKNVGMASFFRGKYLWVIFDRPQKFILPDSKILHGFTQLESEKGTVIKIKVENYNNARAVKIGSKWDIIISKNKNKIKKSALSLKKLENDEGIVINGNFNNNMVLEFYDPEIGDLVKAIPLKSARRVQDELGSIDFKVMPSIQGVAVALNNDEVSLIKSNDSLKIITKHHLLPTTHEPESKNTSQPASLPSSVSKYENIGTLLPILDKNLDIIDFNYNKSRLIREASFSLDKGDLFAKRFELAKFLFMHGWYNECFAALKLSQKATPKEYNSNLQAQFMTAVTNSIVVNNLEDAKEIYNKLLQDPNIPNIGEVALWNNYNDFLIGHNPNTIGFLNNLNTVNSYPDNLYWSIALAEIDLNLLSNNIKYTESMFKELRIPEGKFANSLNFYKANYYRKKDQLNLAKQFLQDLTKKEDDQFNMVRSTMDLVILQLSKKEISLEEAIKTLDKLRFIWRGDQLEYNLLTQLATYYRDSNDVINAFRTYKYIQSAFDNKINNFYITSETVKIFNTIFSPGGSIKNMSDFDAVALFYEFRKMNPIGSEGDQVVLYIVQRLINLDLLEKAAELLQHQVKYRLSGDKRITNADHLAVIFLMDRKPKEAIQILNETDKDNFKFDEHLHRLRLRAKALIDLKKYSEALTYLKDDNSKDALILRKECLFQAGRWQDYINLVSPEAIKVKGLNIQEEVAQDILRLAISYYILNNQQDLENLARNFNLSKGILKDTIDLLLTSNAPIDYKNLDKSLKIDQMQTLLNKYKNQIFTEQ